MKSSILLIVALLALPGCMTVDHTFHDSSPEFVWRALVAVAQGPDYNTGDPDDRWFVKENEVWVDDATARIEIYREVERVLNRANAKPLHESRTWRFQVLYVPGPPASARFISRGWGVPMHARAEADRYFADVELLLAGTGLVDPTDSSVVDPAPFVAPSLDEPVIDIDALEPSG